MGILRPIVEIEGRNNIGDIWLGFGGEYAFGHDGTHCHYAACEGDYRELKSDIKQLLAESTTTSAFAKFELAYKLGSLAVAAFAL